MDRQLEARGILIEEYHRLSEAKRQYEQAWTRYINTGSADEEASVTKWGDVLSAHPERVKEVNTSSMFRAIKVAFSFFLRSVHANFFWAFYVCLRSFFPAMHARLTHVTVF